MNPLDLLVVEGLTNMLLWYLKRAAARRDRLGALAPLRLVQR